MGTYGLKRTQQISRIIIHPDNPNVVFVAAQGAINGQLKREVFINLLMVVKLGVMFFL